MQIKQAINWWNRYFRKISDKGQCWYGSFEVSDLRIGIRESDVDFWSWEDQKEERGNSRSTWHNETWNQEIMRNCKCWGW